MSLREIFGIVTPTRMEPVIGDVALERVDALCAKCRGFLLPPQPQHSTALGPIAVTCVCGWKGQATFLRRQG